MGMEFGREAAPLGLEPRMPDPESGVLPITPRGRMVADSWIDPHRSSAGRGAKPCRCSLITVRGFSLSVKTANSTPDIG